MSLTGWGDTYLEPQSVCVCVCVCVCAPTACDSPASQCTKECDDPSHCVGEDAGPVYTHIYTCTHGCAWVLVAGNLQLHTALAVWPRGSKLSS